MWRKMLAIVLLTVALTGWATFMVCVKYQAAERKRLMVENANLSLKLAAAKLAVVEVAKIHFETKLNLLEDLEEIGLPEAISSDLASAKEDLEGFQETKELLIAEVQEKKAWVDTLQALPE